MDNQEMFGRMMQGLCQSFQRPFNQILVDEYWESLKDFDINDLEHVKSLLKFNCKRFPTIAEWVEKIREVRHEVALKLPYKTPATELTPEEERDARFAREVHFEDSGTPEKNNATIKKRKGMAPGEVRDDIDRRINEKRKAAGLHEKVTEINKYNPSLYWGRH